MIQGKFHLSEENISNGGECEVDTERETKREQIEVIGNRVICKIQCKYK